MVDRVLNLRGRGLRGENFSANARRTGAFGALPDDTDIQVLEKFANWAIAENPGFKGDKGDPGGNVMAISLFSQAGTLSIPNGTDRVQTSGYNVAGRGAAQYSYDASIDASYVSANPRTSFMSANNRGFKLSEIVLSPYMFGAVGDNAANDTEALKQAMLNASAANRVLDLLSGTYRINSTITIEGNFRCINTGGATIRAVAGSYTEGRAIAIVGTATQVADLTANATSGSVTLTSTAAATFANGDMGSIFNPADNSWSSFRYYYHAGEFFEVEASNGSNQITLRNPLYAGYVASAVDLYKISPVTGFIRDLIMSSDGSMETLLYIDYSKDFDISNPTMKHSNNSCISINRSMNTTIVQPKLSNVGNGGDDYGLVIAACQHFRVFGGTIFARRHAITTGGANRINDHVVRDFVAIGSTLKNSRASGIHCADFHGNTEDCGYENCTIYGGATIQGKSVRLINNRINALNIGTCIYTGEIVGGTHEIHGNVFYSYNDPFAVGRGVIDFGGNSEPISDKTVEDVTILVKDNTFVGSAFGAATSIVVVRNRGTTKKINIEVSGNTLRVNNFAQMLYMDKITGTAASDFIIVERNVTELNGKYSMYPDANYAQLPVLRMQRNTWSEVITTPTNAAIVVQPFHTFKWKFPRDPVVLVSSGKHDYAGNRIGIAGASTISNENARLRFGTGDGVNFSAAVSVTLSATASLEEV